MCMHVNKKYQRNSGTNKTIQKIYKNKSSVIIFLHKLILILITDTTIVYHRIYSTEFEVKKIVISIRLLGVSSFSGRLPLFN